MKKLTALIMALTMVLALAACDFGASSEGDTTGSQPTEAQTTPSQTDSQPTAPSEPVGFYALAGMNVVTAEREIRVDISYDDHGRMLGYEIWMDGAMQQGNRMEYTADGTPLTNYTYGPDGAEISRQVYTQMDNGKWTEMRTTADGVSYRTEMERDSEGRPVEQRRYNENDELASRTKYEYDSQGRVTKEVELNDQDMETTVREYIYDESGNLTEFRMRGGDMLILHYLYTYEAGRLVKRVSQTEDGLSYRYEYDERGKLSKVIQDEIVMELHYEKLELSQEDGDALEDAVATIIENAFVLM
ncbi:MAG: hypothetical protein IJV82_03965 [Oscillospiraceae bacterium]|nr:hypothetical protein [Oscillospiraceae bacterium]